MGRPPALIFVTRHGARLDAADPQWHLTSPTPYDPPLTYGGWKQAQALGARIASLVDLWAHAHEESSEHDKRLLHYVRRNKRKKYRVVVHTSPFLRCVQTGIAVSAGMEQWRGRVELDSVLARASPTINSRVRSLDHQSSPKLNSVLDTSFQSRRRSSVTSNESEHRPALSSRNLLRVDAFLGEWLSPDYFDQITPPPASKLMVAGAKADLLRAADPLDPASEISTIFPTSPTEEASSPVQEVKSDILGKSEQRTNGLANNEHQVEHHSAVSEDLLVHSINGDDREVLDEPTRVLPKLTRATTQPGHDAKADDASSSSRPRKSILRGDRYKPPVPTYAVSAAQSIPPGFVAHARDHCVQIDYAWDSLRCPHEWGTGGNYGEEWGAMHRRFRTGMQRMCQWYRSHAAIQEPEDHAEDMDCGISQVSMDTDTTTPDSDVETILIIVTHGAGCNALIGALTSQPVLIDVGMASLTMAERKNIDYTRIPHVNGSQGPNDTSMRPNRRRTGDAISQEYEIRISASTEHLRPGSPFLNPSSSRSNALASLPHLEKSPYRYERPVLSPTLSASAASSPASQRPHQHSPMRNSFDLKSLDTAMSDGDFSEALSTPAKTASAITAVHGSGLWTPASRSRRVDKLESVSEIPSPLKLSADEPDTTDSLAAADSTPSTASSRPPAMTNDSFDTNSSIAPSIARQGLWGAEPRALGTERDRTTPKRRWTLHQPA